MPVDQAADALAGEFVELEFRQRRKVHIGQVRQHEHQSMIPKSGNRFSDKTMLKPKRQSGMTI